MKGISINQQKIRIHKQWYTSNIPVTKQAKDLIKEMLSELEIMSKGHMYGERGENVEVAMAEDRGNAHGYELAILAVENFFGLKRV